MHCNRPSMRRSETDLHLGAEDGLVLTGVEETGIAIDAPVSG